MSYYDEEVYDASILDAVADRQAQRIVEESGYDLNKALRQLEGMNLTGFPKEHEAILASKIQFIINHGKSQPLKPAA